MQWIQNHSRVLHVLHRLYRIGQLSANIETLPEVVVIVGVVVIVEVVVVAMFVPVVVMFVPVVGVTDAPTVDPVVVLLFIIMKTKIRMIMTAMIVRRITIQQRKAIYVLFLIVVFL